MTMGLALLDEFGIGDAQAREESWRYSRNALRALAQADFAAADPRAALPERLHAQIDWAETRGRRIVFVNGAYRAEHSDAGDLAGVAVEHGDGGTVLTFAGPGETAHLVYASAPGAGPSRWSAQSSIRVRARGSRIVEHHVGAAGSDVLGSLRCRIDVAGDADAHLVVLCDMPGSASVVRREDVTVAEDAAYLSTHALFGGRLQRHDVTVRLDGARSRHGAGGVFALRGREHVDVQLDVRHAARDTASDVVWRGVADQRARGILHGAITVAAGADGADARLQTKNLLLSPHAEIDAQPVLEIHVDEVKASHGATVGQLDERALFYLRSRGLPAAQARNLLIGGFCREVLADVADAGLRARLEAVLEARLPQAMAGQP
jgi:Fe-S cluster assembly protein SufD